MEFDGYYLESDPCLVCNNPEVPFCVSTAVLKPFPISYRDPNIYSSRVSVFWGMWSYWQRVLIFLSSQYIKLSSIKVDTRYTTTQQVVKLIGSHTISKVTVKIGDLKRTKMVRTINLYYNNRTVQAIVELKNKYVHPRVSLSLTLGFLVRWLGWICIVFGNQHYYQEHLLGILTQKGIWTLQRIQECWKC